MPELTKMTSKGQVVIPSNIRNELGLKEGTQFVVDRTGDLVLMKKVDIPDPKEELRKMARIGKEFAKKKDIKSEEDVVERIHKGRGIKSD